MDVGRFGWQQGHNTRPQSNHNPPTLHTNHLTSQPHHTAPTLHTLLSHQKKNKMDSEEDDVPLGSTPAPARARPRRRAAASKAKYTFGDAADDIGDGNTDDAAYSASAGDDSACTDGDEEAAVVPGKGTKDAKAAKRKRSAKVSSVSPSQPEKRSKEIKPEPGNFVIRTNVLTTSSTFVGRPVTAG